MPESPARRIKIMISSTRSDLAQYRTEASSVISKVAAEKEKRVQLVEVSMEKEVQSGDREFAVAVSKRWVEESDWVVVIVGWNYGTISDEVGADGLSVTEWEYRHALKHGKKLYVFIAGEPQTANQYRVSDEEEEDLKDWIIRQTEIQAKKLKEFKHDLCRAHAEMFANLQRFRERLEKTLRDAIDDLPPEIQPGTPLAELIVAVLPDIRDCIRRVTLVANCKKTHDYLHELRQHVISPLREEVLAVWKQEGTLSEARERVIWRCKEKRAEAIGGIRTLRRSIGPGHQALRDSVDAMLQRPALWNIESVSESRPSIEDFTEVVNQFASDVQEAFSEADRSMAREESNLREPYFALLDNLKRARHHRKLSATDQQRLDDELEKVVDNRERIKNSLIGHHSWQEGHDKLEELDSFRESENFERKLKHYCGVQLAKLLCLVDNELKQITDAHQRGDATTGLTAVAAAAQQAHPSAPSLQPASDPFVNDLRHLKEALEALRQGTGAVAFDKMRRPFDDAFYNVDKRTLSEVERAQERAINLEDWIDELAAVQKKTFC